MIIVGSENVICEGLEVKKLWSILGFERNLYVWSLNNNGEKWAINILRGVLEIM